MFRFACMLCAVVLLAGVVTAGPVVWSGNGNGYEVVTVDGGILWNDAYLAAISRGGHLATVTSELENDFIYSLAAAIPEAWDNSGTNNLGPWLGASDEDTEDTWVWVTGETFDYENWGYLQPSHNGDYLNIYGMGNSQGRLWNDYNNLVPGYVVEYEDYQEIPEPSVVALLLAGSALALLRKRRA